MKLGVSLVDPATPFDEMSSLAARADQLGYYTIWANESVEREAFTTLSAWSGVTNSAVLATGIAPVFLRPPMTAAMAATTLAEATGPDRVWLGIGAGSARIGGAWFGTPFTSPLNATREYVRIARTLLAGETLTFSGEVFSVEAAAMRHPPAHPIPVVVAAMGPRMLAVASEEGDGVLMNWNSVSGLSDSMSLVDSLVGAREFISAAYVRVATDDDQEKAVAALSAEFSRYLRFDSYRRQLAARGYPDVAAAVSAAWEAGDAASAAEAVTGAVALEFGVAGSEAACRNQLRAYADAGVAHVVVRPVPVGDGGLGPAVEAAAPLLRE